MLYFLLLVCEDVDFSGLLEVFWGGFLFLVFVFMKRLLFLLYLFRVINNYDRVIRKFIYNIIGIICIFVYDRVN